MTSEHGGVRVIPAMLSLLLASALPLAAQQPERAAGPKRLSIAEALRIAQERSEQIAVARAGTEHASGEEWRALSRRLPRLSLSLGYNRTFASQFEGAFEPPERLPTDTTGGMPGDTTGGGGINFEGLPFGQLNTYTLALTLSQTLYAGGRIDAQRDIADAGYRSARLALSSAKAEVALETVRRYYGAVLAGRLLEIAEEALALAEETLEHARLAYEVGRQPEFDVLRAQVAVRNERVALIRRRAERRAAVRRLKQLLDIPPEVPLELTTDLGAVEAERVAELAAEAADVEAEPGGVPRAPVRRARQTVRIREASLDIAESQRLPTVRLTSRYVRLNYPDGVLPSTSLSDYRTNFTAGLTISLPLFLGGRIHGDAVVAGAELATARARLRQTRQRARLDTRAAYDRLEAARAALRATSGTVKRARRAYEIAQVRYREGISTQLELANTRLLLERALADRARAARDLRIARIRVALLPALPLRTTGFEAGGGGGRPGRPAPQPQGPTQQGAPGPTGGALPPGIGLPGTTGAQPPL